MRPWALNILIPGRIKTAQHYYQQVTEKEKKKSTWSKNILGKIEDLSTRVALLKKIKEQVKPDSKDIKQGRKIMHELNLILEKHDDKVEAFDIMEKKGFCLPKEN